MKKCILDLKYTLKIHFSQKSLQNRFTFGHILTREVAWSIKNHMLKMVIDPWPGVRCGGQCIQIHKMRRIFIMESAVPKCKKGFFARIFELYLQPIISG